MAAELSDLQEGTLDELVLAKTHEADEIITSQWSIRSAAAPLHGGAHVELRHLENSF
jgi:hypothetical protein